MVGWLVGCIVVHLFAVLFAVRFCPRPFKNSLSQLVTHWAARGCFQGTDGLKGSADCVSKLWLTSIPLFQVFLGSMVCLLYFVGFFDCLFLYGK